MNLARARVWLPSDMPRNNSRRDVDYNTNGFVTGPHFLGDSIVTMGHSSCRPGGH